MSMQALESQLASGLIGQMFNPLGQAIPKLVGQAMEEKDLALDEHRLNMLDKIQQRIKQLKADGADDQSADVLAYRKMQAKYQAKIS